MLLVWARRAPAIAGIYWTLVLAVFFLLQRLGFDMTGAGSIPLVVLTLPWSLIALMAWASVESLPYGVEMLRPLNSTLGMCVIFPIACGALNTILILATGAAIQRRRKRWTI